MVEPIFTRYLYYKNEVINSLHWSILENQCDESLYWAYELYFSGFQEEVFYYTREFYFMYYQETYPEYETYIDMQHQEWKVFKTDHCIIGTIVKLLVGSRPSLTNAIRIRQKIIVDKSKINEHKVFDTTRIPLCEIHKFRTLKLTKNMRNWTFLNTVACKYKIRRIMCDDLSIDYPTVGKINFDNWLYYASYTPIWKKRILKYGGIIDIDTHTVIIEDENFLHNYDYEPDEQSTELKEMLWTNDIKYYVNLSTAAFCDKYGDDNLYKNISIRKTLNNIVN